MTGYATLNASAYVSMDPDIIRILICYCNSILYWNIAQQMNNNIELNYVINDDFIFKIIDDETYWFRMKLLLQGNWSALCRIIFRMKHQNLMKFVKRMTRTPDLAQIDEKSVWSGDRDNELGIKIEILYVRALWSVKYW